MAITRRTKIFVAKEPTDMRASYDTLLNRARTVIGEDPMSGHLFIFISARRTSCKCLFYDGTGLVIIAKRLEKGLFSRINPYHKDQIVLTQAEFSLFFEGTDLNNWRVRSSSNSVHKNSQHYASL